MAFSKISEISQTDKDKYPYDFLYVECKTNQPTSAHLACNQTTDQKGRTGHLEDTTEVQKASDK